MFGTAAPTSRRAFLAGALAVGAGLTAASRIVRAAAAHTVRLGAVELTVISDGSFTLPASLVLPDAPPGDVERLFAEAGRKVAFAPQVNVTLVRSGSTLVLIDCGAGPDFVPSLGKLADNLEAAGFRPEQVTHVVFTHWHADHLWGMIDPLTDDTRFEKARHLVTAPERDFWARPDILETLPEAQKFMGVGTQRRLKTTIARMETVSAEAEIAPGIGLMDTSGHTPGHASIVVRAGSEEIVIIGDALTHELVSFAAPDWRWGADLDAAKAAAARRRLLDRLAASKARIIGYHLPWPGIGRGERSGAAYRYVPAA